MIARLTQVEVAREGDRHGAIPAARARRARPSRGRPPPAPTTRSEPEDGGARGVGGAVRPSTLRRPLLLRQAVAMLFHDRAKLIGMVFGLAFSSLLMTQQLGVFLAVLELSRHTIDDSRADLWVGDPQAVLTTQAAPLRQEDVARVASVDGVAWASAFAVRTELVRRRDGSHEQCQLFVVDPRTLAAAPTAMLSGRVEDLRRPDAVILDEEAIDHLAAAAGSPARYAVGDVVVVGDRRLILVGIAPTQRNFQFQPELWTTSFGGEAGPRPVGFVLAGARPGVDRERLAESVSRATGLRAMTSAAFADANFAFLLRNTGIPANFAIAVALGFIVGLAIAGQTFLQFVNDHLRHFAALRAMGATARTIIAMVSAQALVAGALGYGIGVGMAAIFDRAVDGTMLVSRLAPGLLVATAGATVAIVLLAAACGGWRATRADPASVFRS